MPPRKRHQLLRPHSPSSFLPLLGTLALLGMCKSVGPAPPTCLLQHEHGGSSVLGEVPRARGLSLNHPPMGSPGLVIAVHKLATPEVSGARPQENGEQSGPALGLFSRGHSAPVWAGRQGLASRLGHPRPSLCYSCTSVSPKQI